MGVLILNFVVDLNIDELQKFLGLNCNFSFKMNLIICKIYHLIGLIYIISPPIAYYLLIHQEAVAKSIAVSPEDGIIYHFFYLILLSFVIVRFILKFFFVMCI